MINKFLLETVIYLIEIIKYLMTLLVGKNLLKSISDEPVKKEYRKLQVDDQPIFDVPEKLNYKLLIAEYEFKHGKEFAPVKPRKNKALVPKDVICPKCGAPHTYLYDNNGGRGQYLCKVCDTTFNPKNYYQKSIVLRCPHCSKTLERIKARKDFYVYKCKNDNCSFYQNNLKSMTKSEKQDFKKNPGKFKVRYIFRDFTFDFKPLSKESPVKSKVSLPNIMISSYTLGLILTYYVNYGLSSRKTAALLKDIHDIKISHQAILNYVNAVSIVVKPFIDNYDYKLSDSFCGDETYIKVNGKWNYIFFFFDAVKKIILSYRVSPHRDTETAVKAIDDVLSKLKEIPEDLNLITDGNPIYLLAQHFFASHSIKFDVTQVIGLTNKDEISKEYRPLKQIIERLNRTFKGNYRATTGFGSPNGSVAFVTMFVAYFNFLRPHSALEGKTPVILEELESMPNMPTRWCKFIELSQDFVLNNCTITA
ncbi:DDE-type integrase/transposase/recombinase [Clostridium beijerinckii]|nr:DDE-type integrase/transposase/recombinase [Parabacteroides distasonis]MZK52028.1 DDE-type integrase/transposase/recombinase [Clostridium beijerinckii]MZK60169.1 DDE-type integrase/transposase/recombinase [Clostridium beijerinckii]MZK70454.1 DDE-type integrase/transposase/recombinase [Clostridium beijerinckii]MZK75756.1 DDE-type integrase/transposase/recombinase [Clostridium beijerinckii]